METRNNFPQNCKNVTKCLKKVILNPHMLLFNVTKFSPHYFKRDNSKIPITLNTI